MPREELGRSALLSRKPTDKLTIEEVSAELGISRSTFYYWRQLGKAPRSIKLPNGKIRVRRTDLERWIEQYEEAE